MGNSPSGESPRDWDAKDYKEAERSESLSSEFGTSVDLALDRQSGGLWKVLRGEEGRVLLSFRRTPTSIEEAESLLRLLEKIQDLGSIISSKIIDPAGVEIDQEASRWSSGMKEERELARRVEQLTLRKRMPPGRKAQVGSVGVTSGPKPPARTPERRDSNVYPEW